MSTVKPQPDRLLAIDRSKLIHRLLKAHLKGEPIELHSAYSGDEGLIKARALEPQAILLDLECDRNGVDVLTILKRDHTTQRIPVIILSGSSSVADLVRALDMGAVDFVRKPFEIAELRARVRSALRMTHLINMLAQRAQLDGLTGLWNRAYFDERLEQEIASAQRHGHDLAVAICDLDHFKSINDGYGHPFGDHVLEEFARILSGIRITDIVCRYGGEEFAIIAPHTNAPSLIVAMERIRQTLASHKWPGREDLRATVSVGVTDLTLSRDPAPMALVSSADRALYRAKRLGRNTVCIDEAPAAQRVSA